MIQDILELKIEPGEGEEKITENVQNVTETAMIMTPNQSPQQPQGHQKEDFTKKEQKRTTEKKERFLKSLLELWPCAIEKACWQASINKDTFYEWKKKDPNFRKKLSETYDAIVESRKNQIFEKF